MSEIWYLLLDSSLSPLRMCSNSPSTKCWNSTRAEAGRSSREWANRDRGSPNIPDHSSRVEWSVLGNVKHVRLNSEFQNVLTHSHSLVVLEALRKAHSEGVKLHVWVGKLNTFPWPRAKLVVHPIVKFFVNVKFGIRNT